MSSIFGNFNRSLFFCLLFSNFHPSYSRSSQNTSKCKYDEDIIKSDELLRYLRNAEFIFTGKVTSSVKTLNDSIVFDVSVQRCFKNSGNLQNDAAVGVVKRLRNGEGVNCRQVVRKKFTAIFVGVADKRYIGDVELLLSPIPITLGNLDRVSVATKGMFLTNKFYTIASLQLNKF
ncbi:hypothetical protein WA026_010427 [Henosepilachna vigintioctopunctata]|uniref:NtA domain-containing protein n=1 Tax=Henosepilachna vigintioctopunctata TaxID=420089 RepID=A0AAW1V503_9CUCU